MIPTQRRLKQEDCDFKVSLGEGVGKEEKKEAGFVENVNRSEYENDEERVQRSWNQFIWKLGCKIIIQIIIKGNELNLENEIESEQMIETEIIELLYQLV